MKKPQLLNKQRVTATATGNYIPGCTDILTEKGETGLLFRLFYPSSANSLPVSRENWTKWHLGKAHSKGFAKHSITPTVFEIFFIMAAEFNHKNTATPAIWNAEISEGKFPVVIFSHGLGANRSLYSNICSELASHGFIVAAIEHKDRSASATFIINQDDKKQWLKYTKRKTRKCKDQRMRLEQMQIRMNECSQLLDIFTEINDEKIGRYENQLPSNKHLTFLQNKMDLSKPVIAGQSFGAATAIAVLAYDKRFRFGICLDPWMRSLSGFNGFNYNFPDKTPEIANIEQPICFLLMENFQNNFSRSSLEIFKNNRNTFWTIRKGTHLGQTDVSYLFKDDNPIVQLYLSCYSRIPADIAVNLNSNLMLEFLSNFFGSEDRQLEDRKDYLSKHSKWLVRN